MSASALTHRPEQLNVHTLRYNEFRHWSAALGGNATRLAMYDRHGGEYFALIAQEGTGRQNREAKYRALECIEDAITRGDPPGEVEVTEAREEL